VEKILHYNLFPLSIKKKKEKKRKEKETRLKPENSQRYVIALDL
jgi:hypothetical protein